MCLKRTIHDISGIATLKSVLHFSVPPDIVYDDTSGDLAVAEGDNATLWCRATGHPTPRITWRREDGESIILRKGAREATKRKYSFYYYSHQQ